MVSRIMLTFRIIPAVVQSFRDLSILAYCQILFVHLLYSLYLIRRADRCQTGTAFPFLQFSFGMFV